MHPIIQALLNEAEQTDKTVNHAKIKELDVLVVRHPLCNAVISLYGGHLLHWQPTHSSHPVLWLSLDSLFQKGKAIRGGVPICWPWFGKVNTPAHGFARLIDWTLMEHHSSDENVSLTLTLTNNEHTADYIKTPFNVSLQFTLGNTCDIKLITKGNLNATSALHSYFTVNNIETSIVKGLGANYQEKLLTDNKPSIIGELTFNQEVDRVYTEADAEQQIVDEHRTITLHSHHCSDIVTWNPWMENANNMADLSDYKTFVCVEHARINKPIISTELKSVSYGVTISVDA